MKNCMKKLMMLLLLSGVGMQDLEATRRRGKKTRGGAGAAAAAAVPAVVPVDGAADADAYEAEESAFLAAENNSVLRMAAWDGNLDEVKRLLAAGADPKDKMNGLGHTALHGVATAEIASALLAAGADVMARTAKQKTPLHLVKNAAVANVLVEAGADVFAEDEDGLTPFTIMEAELRIMNVLLVVNPGAEYPDGARYGVGAKLADQIGDVRGVVDYLRELVAR